VRPEPVLAEGGHKDMSADPSSVASPQSLDRDERLRYTRHLVLPEVGLEGQLALKNARVAIVGAGGLGSPVALYLAAAGVGTLGLFDFDRVDASNLQRQILHGTKDIGRSKLASAQDRLTDVNPHVEVERHPVRLSSDNAMDLLSRYDLVVDGTDNFPTRYLVNDACVLLGKPNVYGAILKWEGQVSVFAAPDGPCYRCLFREPPPPGLVPSCAEAGVMGVLPGIIGSAQALEAVKLILGKGRTLAGRFLIFDALDMSWREIALRRDPQCPLCGETPTQKTLIDYEDFCGVPSPVPTVEPEDLIAELRSDDPPFLLDVREPFEWGTDNLERYGAVLVPLAEVDARGHELPRDRDIVVYCQVGARSERAVRTLQELGFHRVRNLVGGLTRWLQAGLDAS
jgi:molybdopterin/thiamine biosynthesis adenylyltransferase/rhodanese-related sulfurtransferase